LKSASATVQTVPDALKPNRKHFILMNQDIFGPLHKSIEKHSKWDSKVRCLPYLLHDIIRKKYNKIKSHFQFPLTVCSFIGYYTATSTKAINSGPRYVRKPGIFCKANNKKESHETHRPQQMAPRPESNFRHPK
jgi:hypothetical protein